MRDLPPALDRASGARLEAYLHRNIPLAAHMQVRVAACDRAGLRLTAPLAPNINHQSTAFGGSLASLATLACWGLTWLLIGPGTDTAIVVNECHMTYLRPVTDTLVAMCPAPGSRAERAFSATLMRHRKARIELIAQILQAGVICARFNGTFVARCAASPAAI